MEKVDVFEGLRRMGNVEKVSNFWPEVMDRPLNFRFFLCPKISGRGYRLNENLTGFTVKYVKGIRNSSFQRINRVKSFLKEFEAFGLPYDVKGIMASGEALILFPIPVSPPEVPLKIMGIPIISNYELAKIDFIKFGQLYKAKPWMNIPQKFREAEFSHFAGFLQHEDPSSSLVQDFVERVFAEYALDGLWAREGKFGENPVFIGVESSEVPVLQNAALSREKWIPVIQLK